jgi:NOL1/NOP2/fmu family ribosome biogenesis protein
MCARRQAEILDSAAAMLRPGGRLVYSTCTFSPEENEGTVSAFLRRHPDFSVAAADAPWFEPGRPDWVPDGQPELARTFRLWPHRLRGEGHFAAVLQRRGEAASADVGASSRPALRGAEKLPAEVRELLHQLDVCLPEGFPLLWGERVFWAPPELPDLRGLKALRPGLELAVLKKGRAEPAHALALFLRGAANVRDLTPEEADRYLRGETIPSPSGSGWTLLRLDGCSLGWAKAAGGVLKNHYPKGLRTVGQQK